MSEFDIDGFQTSFGLDCNSTDGGTTTFVWEDIPAKLIRSLKKQNCFLSCSFNPNKSVIGQHLEALSKSMNLNSSTYENFTLLRNLNADKEHIAFKDFCNLYFLTRLINKPTCWKYPSNPSCIDVILTSLPKYSATHF